MDVSDPLPIPIDLFVSKKHEAYKNGDSCFVDSDGNTIYKVNRRSSVDSSSSSKRVLRDAVGTPLISMHRHHVSLKFSPLVCFSGKSLFQLPTEFNLVILELGI